MYFYLTFLLCIFGLSEGGPLTDKEKKGMIKYGLECIKETNLDPDLLKGTVHGEFPDNPEFKKYLLCFHLKTGMQNADGQIQKDLIEPYIKKILNDDDKTKEVVEKCLVDKDTPENTAYEMAKCTFPYIPKGEVTNL